MRLELVASTVLLLMNVGAGMPDRLPGMASSGATGVQGSAPHEARAGGEPFQFERKCRRRTIKPFIGCQPLFDPMAGPRVAEMRHEPSVHSGPTSP